MYSSNNFKRLFIQYKMEAMSRKSMEQGYAILNYIRVQIEVHSRKHPLHIQKDRGYGTATDENNDRHMHE